jgi:hypothetical protein
MEVVAHACYPILQGRDSRIEVSGHTGQKLVRPHLKNKLVSAFYNPSYMGGMVGELQFETSLSS